MAAFSTSMDFFGVSTVSMDSYSTCFTCAVIEENASVRFPTNDKRTESAILPATSTATFLDIKEVLKLVKMGWRSSSVRVTPPVKLFTLRVSVLKSPPTRPVFPDFAPSGPGRLADGASSSSEPEDTDATSSASEAPPSSPNIACFALMASGSSTLFLGPRHRSSMSFLETGASSHFRACLPLLPFSSSLDSFGSFFLGPPGLIFACAFAGAVVSGATSSAVASSSPLTSLSSLLFLSPAPLLPFFFGTVVVTPFSSLFFSTF
mmetsp:Transcript_118343/g.335626  ORF Transcript_118343/g.335626 Transcript_118343/m.335626 type:complete len:263 (+) Transcript_118343:834-1622(+)